MTSYQATVHENKQLTPDVWQLTLALDAPITFMPGQYISFEFKENGQIFRKPYSLLTPPDGPMQQIDVCVKRVGVFSGKLCDLQPGDMIKILGPFGKFTLEPAKKIIYVATSTGLSPLFCMLTTHPTEESWLFFGARTEKDLLFHDKLSDLDINYIPVLSKPEQDWLGEQGHVQDSLTRHWLEIKGAIFYVCGGKGMVDDVKKFLLDKNVSKERIKFEEFR